MLPPGLRSALVDAVGRALADAHAEWRKDLDRISAEARAVVAELKAENAGLRAQLKEFTDGQAARIDARLATLKDGEDGEDGVNVERADIEAMVRSVADSIPRPKDGDPGKGVTLDDVAPLIDAGIAKAVAALPPPKDGEDGKSVEPGTVKAMVADQIAAAMATIRVPEDGKDADPALIERMVAAAVSALPPPKDGQSITIDDVAPLIAGEVARAVGSMPRPKDGENGAPVDPAEVRAMVDTAVSAAVAALPPAQAGKDANPEATRLLVRAEVSQQIAELSPAKDGKSVTAEETRPLIVEEVTKAVGALPPAKDGIGLAGALIDRDGNLIITLTDGATRELGSVVGRDGSDVDMAKATATIREEVAKIPAPKDGKDALGFDDMTVEHDGERSVTLRFVRGEKIKEFPLTLPIPLDRGVYRDGEVYQRGDGVTFGGCWWIAQGPTEGKPDGGKGWRLAVKKGRDGKEVVTTRHIPPVKVGD